jgi:hypothetical protein
MTTEVTKKPAKKPTKTQIALELAQKINAHLDGAGEHPGELPRDEAEHDERPAHGDHAPLYPGAVGGFWGDAEWVPCLDGVARPIKPRLAVLVARTPRGVGGNRAARLKGYGNSIVLPLASTFIGAVIDALVGAEISAPASVPVAVTIAEDLPEPPPEWTGPREGEITSTGLLYGRLPGERWPYGPPSAHDPVCNLFPHRGSPGGLFCDCAAGGADAVEQEGVA